MSDITLDELPAYIEGLQAEIERLREVARKLFLELEGDDQHFDAWLAKQEALLTTGEQR